MNYHPLTWLTWFAWGFFMSIGWAMGAAVWKATSAFWVDAFDNYKQKKALAESKSIRPPIVNR